MTDREKSAEKNASGKTATSRTTDENAPQDPDLGQQNDPDSQQTTTSRPRGHTEEPDRTL
jgi:hypothetical protein